MILDNNNGNKKVYEWIKDYTEKGQMEVVTGYFTVGALAYLSKQVNEKISEFKLVLGDIVSTDIIEDRTIDLLNENIAIETALQLSTLAKEAVAFLRQEKVLTKTLEPNFCHAKMYLFKTEEDDRHNYFISGSSNMTEAGIGLKKTNNIELNIAETGHDYRYKELIKWFQELWDSKEAHKEKTIVAENGKKYKMPFKEYLIDSIEKIFKEYTPEDLYYKVLFELFGNQIVNEQNNPEFSRQVGRLENTAIYNTLYNFQQKGVISLIKMLQKYDGAILADAVGLGKTWSALAVMKYYQMQGREIVLICPKKLQYNWHRYQRHQNSRFEKDQLEYFIRYHTDMQLERMERYRDRSDKLFTNQKPKLFVIDESHHLRNSKSQRYKFLVEEILRKNEDVKVLMLSATPINNTLIDIRNQFKLIKRGREEGFLETHAIRNIDHLFNRAQHKFFEWRGKTNPKISEFIKELPGDFFKLTDSMTVARTRPMIEKQNTALFFPKKNKPENIFVTPKEFGSYETFEELFENFPPLLSGYQPAFYIEQEKNIKKTEDERQRDRFLVKMIYILMVKRLESSWYAFYQTVQKILEYYKNALNKVNNYIKTNEDESFEEVETTLIFDEEEEDEELEMISEEFTIGKKRKITLQEIDDAGNIQAFKDDLKKDIQALNLLESNLKDFQEEIDKEPKFSNGSKEKKLDRLMKKIIEKQVSSTNNGNKKILIFTVYKDTAFYLFKELKRRGFDKMAVITGSESKTDDSDHITKKFEPILERFAPFTKLYTEKEWDFKPSSDKLSIHQKYSEWKEWIANNDEKTNKKIKNPIDILITTDVLSEGQNLQDCDMVINYDIHWNPVRIIQRMGRIDRLGSPNDEIFGINFWPSENINNYLNLKGRIEERMAMMKIAGSEVNLEFTESFKEMAADLDFEEKMNQKMILQMQNTWVDIEEEEETFGFDDLSLEDFRQDLYGILQKNEDLYKKMPKGVYTGFEAIHSDCEENGIIALLGYPAKPPRVKDHVYQSYELIYINLEGNEVLLNQKDILNLLASHKKMPRVVPDSIDKGDPKAIEKLVNSFKEWLNRQTTQQSIDILSGISNGDKNAVNRMRENIKVSDQYQLDKFDLITWFLVQREGK